MGYGFAVVAVGAAGLMRWPLVRAFGPLPPFVLMYPAVLAVALIAGSMAGALATVLAAMFNFTFVFEHSGPLTLAHPGDLLSLGLFIGGNMLIYLLADRVQRMRGLEDSEKQRQADEAFRRERESQLEQFVRQTPASIAMFDTNMRYLAVSDRWLTDFSLAAERLQGRSHYEVFPEIPERWKEIHRRCLAGAIERSDEDRFVRADGTEHWLRWEVRPWTQLDGKIGGIIVFTEDITARKRAAVALEESEERLRWSFQGSGGGAWSVELESGKVWWSTSMYELRGVELGANVETMNGSLDQVLPEDRQRVVDAFTNAIRDRTDYRSEFRLNHPTRGLRWMASFGRASYGPEGKPLRLHGITLDVTDRKVTDEKLRASEQRYRELFDTMQESLFVAEVIRDETGRPVDWRYVETNPHVERLMGVAAGELIGLTYSQVVMRPDPNWLGLVGQVAQSRESVRRELFAPARNRWFDVLAYSPRPNQVAILFSDITQRFEDQQKLRTAMQNAEAANAAKDQFLAVLSHELRTPLAPVLAALSMLSQSPRIDKDSSESLEMIRRNVELEARLIDDLLDVTRISKGKVELDKRPMSLETVIQRATEVCMPDILARHQTYSIDAPDGPYMMEADAARLQQIFWNLLKNAVKFMHDGGKLGIRCRRDGAEHVIVEVFDNGEGIRAELLPKIFDAFEQGDRRSARQFGGLGLGLAISKAITELHGGTITAQSDGVGKGATFTLRLPMQPAPVTPAPVAAEPAPASANESVKSLRILLVEDHGDTARVMRKLLMLSGHRVQIAADVASALRLFTEQTFDLLLSDLGLPDGSGLDLIRNARQRGLTLPAIAMSGYGQEEDLRQSREAGFAAHLVKPVNPAKLEETMVEVMRRATQ